MAQRRMAEFGSIMIEEASMLLLYSNQVEQFWLLRLNESRNRSLLPRQ